MNRFCFIGEYEFIKSRFNNICDVIAETFNATQQVGYNPRIELLVTGPLRVIYAIANDSANCPNSLASPLHLSKV